MWREGRERGEEKGFRLRVLRLVIIYSGVGSSDTTWKKIYTNTFEEDLHQRGRGEKGAENTSKRDKFLPVKDLVLSL
jgi:hypothetical protein